METEDTVAPSEAAFISVLEDFKLKSRVIKAPSSIRAPRANTWITRRLFEY